MNTRQIAHEIKNHLSILDIYINILEKKPQKNEAIEEIKKSIASIKGLVDELKNTENKDCNFQIKNIKDIVQKSVALYKKVLEEKNNRIVLDIQEDLKINVDEEKFLLVVNNIIKNAHEATKDDEIIIKITKKDSNVEIDFINHGEKITQENQKKIFNACFTTKNQGWGEGLGVCVDNIRLQNGNLELKKSDEKETIFTITMPVV